MSKRTKRMVSILLTLSLLVALLVPMAAPAGARSTNGISRNVSVTDNYISNTTTGALAELTLKEDSDFANDFRTGDRFRVTLKSGVKWVRSFYDPANPVPIPGTLPVEYFAQPSIATNNTTSPGGLGFSIMSDTNMEITILDSVTGNDPDVETITIPLYVDINGVSGDITVTLENIDSAITANTYTFATSKSTKTTATVESVETIGKSGEGGLIRIDEVSPGALTSTQILKLKLPGSFTWDGFSPATDVKFGGGFDTIGATVSVIGGANSQTLELEFDFLGGTAGVSRGSIYIKTPIKASSNASYGDVEVSVSGGDFEDADLLIAKYMNWGVEFTVKSVKDLSAGKLEDITTDTIKIEETISGSLVSNRDVTITLPEWVKVTGVSSVSKAPGTISDWGVANVGVDENIDGRSNEFDIRIKDDTGSSNNLGKIEFKLDITIEANKTGEIEATISGAGIEETSIVVANAIAPVSATVEQVGEVKIGIQSQDIPDIYITEEIKGAAKNKPSFGGQGYIQLTAPDGVKFAATPTAEVTEGNLTLKAGAKLDVNNSNISDSVFKIPVDSDSTRPSTVKISNIKLTVDRTYPEGDILLRVGGSALVENVDTQRAGWLNRAYATGAESDSSVFTTGSIVRLKVANCVTPAPGEVMTTDTVFTIGSTTYTLNGVEQTMDIAPYIKDDRTFIPLRFVARATGVSDDNIIFNQEYQTVTMIKGDRVVVVTIGSNILQVNGAAVTMDTAPELVDPPGRTMFPIRWVATALGCNVDWDPDTQEVRIY